MMAVQGLRQMRYFLLSLLFLVQGRLSWGPGVVVTLSNASVSVGGLSG